MIGEVKAERDAYLERSSAYASPAEKAMAEARLQYFELLIADLELVAETHDDVMDGLDDELEGANSGLADATSYMQESMRADDPNPQPIDDVPLLEGLEYRVSGSPSYLVTENVTAEDVPAVVDDEAFAPMAAQNANYFSIPYDSVTTGILSRIPQLDLGEEEQEVPLRMAGDTLRAAMLAEEIGADVDEDVNEIDDLVKGSIDELAFTISEDTIQEIEQENKGPGGDVSELSSAVQEVFHSWESTDERAIAIGEGEATDDVTETIVKALKDDPPSEFEDRQEAWEAQVAAVARAIVIEAISESTVSFGDGLADLDDEIRSELEDVSEDVIEERLENAEVIDEDGDIVISDEEEWLQGDSPARVPAGLPVLPAPGYWVVTANVWDVNVEAEYARFEVSANTGSPMSTTGTTYVREDRNSTVRIDGETKVLGSNEALSFDSQSVVVVVVPPGGQGVGDRTGVNTECSESWPESGYIDEDAVESCAD